jgi:hypothetical protein
MGRGRKGQTMKSLALVLVTALAAGCGGSGSEPEKSASVGAFNVRSAIFNTIFPNSNSEYTAIKLFDFEGACDKIMRAEHAPGSSHLLLTLVENVGALDTSRASVPGDYVVHAPATSVNETTNAEFEKRDSNCASVDSLSSEAGKVTVERVDASTIAGSYDLSQFSHYVGTDLVMTSDTMNGRFTATLCDAFQLTEECL